MTEKKKSQENSVISVNILRKLIGIFGIALPLILVVGAALCSKIEMKQTISLFYHTPLGDIFVGALFSIGVFLLAYKGPYGEDTLPANLAGVLAILTALIRTNSDPTDKCDFNWQCLGSIGCNLESQCANFVGCFHVTFAILLFLTLGYFCLFIFTRTKKGQGFSLKRAFREEDPGGKNARWRLVYRICGFTIFICIVLILLTSFYFRKDLPGADTLKLYNPIFWLEAIAVWGFGISWLIKGRAN